MKKFKDVFWLIMCFFDHSFGHIFLLYCLSFCLKNHPLIPRKYDVHSNCLKIQQLQFSLEEKSSFFAAPEVVTEFLVAWCLSIVGQVAKASYTRCLLGVRNNFASLGIVDGAELLFE